MSESFVKNLIASQNAIIVSFLNARIAVHAELTSRIENQFKKINVDLSELTKDSESIHSLQ